MFSVWLLNKKIFREDVFTKIAPTLDDAWFDLLEELNDCAEICYGIDRREVSAKFPVYKPEDDLPEADAVIVTPAYEFEEIEDELKKKLTCPIYSIEDIVYFMD